MRGSWKNVFGVLENPGKVLEIFLNKSVGTLQNFCQISTSFANLRLCWWRSVAGWRRLFGCGCLMSFSTYEAAPSFQIWLATGNNWRQLWRTASLPADSMPTPISYDDRCPNDSRLTPLMCRIWLWLSSFACDSFHCTAVSKQRQFQ